MHVRIDVTLGMIFTLTGQKVLKSITIVAPESQVNTVTALEFQVGQYIQLTPKGGDKLIGIAVTVLRRMQHGHRVGYLLKTCRRQREYFSVGIAYRMGIIGQNGLRILGINRHQRIKAQGTAQNRAVFGIGLNG